MYVAELKGKLSSRIEYMEDVLTSYVFSFFKYAHKKAFLVPFLIELGFSVSEKEADEAEFIFWPCYEDGTEPDVVLLVGNYYILFEAKYFSDFGQNQLRREMENGRQDAKNKRKQFYLIAVTADYSEPREKFYRIRKFYNFRWFNWQFVTSFLEKKLKEDIPDRGLADDLYSLLIKKNLRIFDGFPPLFSKKPLVECRFALFDYISAKHRGTFIGFLGAFAYWSKKIEKHRVLFFNTNREFSWVAPRKKFTRVNKRIFFRRIRGG